MYLTTVDNPYHPAKEFNDWFSYDESYHQTLPLIGRLSLTTEYMSEDAVEEEYEATIRFIVQEDIEGKYILIE